MPTDITNLYTQNPGVVRVAPTPQVGPATAPPIERAAASTASASSAKATGYKAINREVGTDELADAQLDRITSQDSPLMKRARQEGMLSAARRGLQNSSIAAGAAQGAMVDRAAPIAMQNSQHLLTQGLANMEATNRATEVSTGRETDVSVANAQMATQMAGLNAQLQTAVSQGNASEANNIRLRMAELNNSNSQFNAGLAQDANLANANAANTLQMTVMNANAELNRQYLAGTQAIDLATVQGAHQLLISQNETAGNLFGSASEAIAQILSNNQLEPTRAAQAVRLINENLDAGLRLIDSLNGGSGAGGSRSQLPATPSRSQTQGNTITLPGGQTITIPGFQGAVV